MLTPGSAAVYDEYGNQRDVQTYHVDWDAQQAEKGGFEHFMIKEIHEEPKVMADTLKVKDGRINLESIGIDESTISGISKVGIIACGTAYHAGMVGKYVIEDLARIPVEVEIASEFRYRKPIITPGQLVIIISQSGETAGHISCYAGSKEVRR